MGDVYLTRNTALENLQFQWRRASASGLILIPILTFIESTLVMALLQRVGAGGTGKTPVSGHAAARVENLIVALPLLVVLYPGGACRVLAAIHLVAARG